MNARSARLLVAVLVLAAVAILGLFLLGAFSGPSGGEGGTPGTKTLTFWHIQTKHPGKAAVEAAVARFFAAHPEVEVEISALENDAFKQKLRTAMSALSPPDVFYTWGGGVLAADAAAGRVLDLTDCVPEEELASISPAALAFCRADGRLWALPADVAAVVFWYNRDIFKEHGLEPPGTYAELLAVCEKLRAAGVAPIALGNRDAWPGAFFYVYFALRFGGLDPFADALARREGASFEHPSFIAAGRRVREMVEKRCFTDGVASTDYAGARRLFFQGRAAMILMGPWLLMSAKDEAPEGFLGKMGCFPFPTLKAGTGDPSLVVGGVNAGYAVAAGAEHPGAAVALARELASVESALDWARTGRIPARTDEAVRAALPPETRPVAAILARAKGIQLYYDQALGPELGEVHKTATQELFAGRRTPREAARVMEEKARAAAERAKR